MTTNDAKERLGKIYWLAVLEKNGQATEEQHDELGEIIQEVMSLDIMSTSILFMRYRWRFPFKAIAKEIHYSVAQTRRLHDAAVEKYRKTQERSSPSGTD